MDGGGEDRPVAANAEDAATEHFRAIFNEFLDGLRYASVVYEVNSSIGAEMACRAVGQYLRRLEQDARLANPFMNVARAFRDLQKGVTPSLFTLDKTPGERDRSGERKFQQAWVVAILDVLIEKGVDKASASARVARGANSWWHFQLQDITASTVQNWRDMLKASPAAERLDYEIIRQGLRAQLAPERLIETVLKDGPPGSRRDGKT